MSRNLILKLIVREQYNMYSILLDDQVVRQECTSELNVLVLVSYSSWGR